MRRGASSVCDLTVLEFWTQDLCTYPSRSHHQGRTFRSGCSASQWKSLLGIPSPCLEAARVTLSKVAPHILAAGEICCGKPERNQFETPSSENLEIKRALSAYHAVRSWEACEACATCRVQNEDNTDGLTMDQQRHRGAHNR